MTSLRKFTLPAVFVLLFLLVSARPAGAYSVLTHEELIDLIWADSVKPLLLKRFPTMTPAELREAHAYAYGGCVIQDLGYYPFEKPLFSNLLHYVRTGDFIRALFRESKGPDDVAFAIGALSHYYGDTIGHANAVNLAVSDEFPKLRARFGHIVNYAEGPHPHVRVEFAFDVNDIAKHRLAPENYLNHIGFAVPFPLLTRAFYDTYGLDIDKVLEQKTPQLRAYRYAVRTLLPRVAYAETLLNHKRMPPDVPSPALDELKQEIAAVATQDRWKSYRGHAGFGTHLLAGFIYILPKFGPLAALAIRPPTASSEQDYINSLVLTADTLRQTLAQATHSGTLPNKDLDTGDDVHPGTYSLEDDAYADLLHAMTSDPSAPIPFGIKRDLLQYFADPKLVKFVYNDAKMRAQVEAELPILKTISTKAQYPETAFLPEPEDDKPQGVPSPAASGSHRTSNPTAPADSKPASDAPSPATPK